MVDRKVRCEIQHNDDVSNDAIVAVQVLMQLNNNHNNNNNNTVRRRREKRIPRKEVDQRSNSNKISEIDEPEKIKYRSLADIYAVTKPVNPKK
ncbi:hypothetical protein TSUD_319010 [Trifolium subterraneum]|uniref:Uncharacterized protein n=1 Tax=Trifolium subterraneum TaxID=3900 RepID=A0A2Z6MXG0_TRISU|nr:hypothetical protein TSUD_319010 [Trifolium subterraneum]